MKSSKKCKMKTVVVTFTINPTTFNHGTHFSQHINAWVLH